MTKAEMTKLFAAMSLIYRHDKMFSAGVEALKPTIELWTAALHDISFELGQRALMRLIRTCKYPPTPAELAESAENVRREIMAFCSREKDIIRLNYALTNEDIEQCVSYLSDSVARRAIERIGGADKLLAQTDSGNRFWNWDAFEKAYMEISLSGGTALPEAKANALPAKKG